MKQAKLDEITAKLHKMTPSLVNDALTVFQQDPYLVARYGKGLREVAQQGVSSLRDVLLGALQFDHPQLLGSELKWLERLLEARQINPQTLQTHLHHFRARLDQDLPPEDAKVLLIVFDQAVEILPLR